MLLLAFLLIPAVFALETEITINNYIVKINGGALISVNPTPTSSFVLNLSDLRLEILAENAFENSTILKNLDLGNNFLSSIPKQLFSSLGNLEHLSLAKNNLTNFKKVFEGLDHLKTLNISNNPLNRLNATALFGLPRSSVVFTKGLSLELINAFVFEKEPGTSFKSREYYKRSISNARNPTRQIQMIQDQDNLAKIEGRKRRDVDNNRLIKICIDGDILKRVEPFEDNETLSSDCHREELNKPHLLDLKNLDIAGFQSNWYQLDTITSITEICFAKNNIVRVTSELINDLPANVYVIDLGSNKIERLEVDILENTHIRVMDLRSNVIREIEAGAFTKMSRLYKLQLSDNLLNNTRFMATLPARMRNLRVSRNDITEISPHSFSTNSGLMFLYLDGNRIQEVKSDSLHGLDYLMELVLSDNRISTVEPESFQQSINMYSIDLRNNKIVSFENGTFDNLIDLALFDVSYNKLSDIKKNFPKGLPSNLNTLNLGFNKIKKLDSDNFKNLSLRYLIVSGNKISEIEHGALELPTLKELYLDNNRLAQLDNESFRGLTNLDVLTLGHNGITSIPNRFTTNMHRLDALDLSYNPIRRLQNGTLHGFGKTAYDNVWLKGVPVEIIEGGLFDDA